jgi:hypothetical protein
MERLYERLGNGVELRVEACGRMRVWRGVFEGEEIAYMCDPGEPRSLSHGHVARDFRVGLLGFSGWKARVGALSPVCTALDGHVEVGLDTDGVVPLDRGRPVTADGELVSFRDDTEAKAFAQCPARASANLRPVSAPPVRTATRRRAASGS